MSAKPYPEITTARIGGDKPVNQTLLGLFHDRQESLISWPVDLAFALKSTALTDWQAVASLPLYLPPAVGTDNGDVVVRLVFETLLGASSTGEVQARLGATGAWISTGSLGDAAWTRRELVIPADDVKAAAGSEATLEIQHRALTGTGGIQTRNLWPAASRIERQP